MATKPRHTHIVAEESDGRAFERVEESPIKAQTARMVIANCGGRIIRNVYCTKPIAECRKPENLIGGTPEPTPQAAPTMPTSIHPGRLYYCQAPGHWDGNVFYVADGAPIHCPGCGAGHCQHERHPESYGACYDSAQIWANLENATPDRLLSRGACRLMPESAPIPGWIVTTDTDGEQHAAPDLGPDAPCPDCGAHPPHNTPDHEIDCDCGVTGCQCAHPPMDHATREAAQRADEAELTSAGNPLCARCRQVIVPEPGDTCADVPAWRRGAVAYCQPLRRSWDNDPAASMLPPTPPVTTTLPNGHERHEYTDCQGQRTYIVDEVSTVNGQRIGRQVEWGTVDAPTLKARLALALTGQLAPIAGGSEPEEWATPGAFRAAILQADAQAERALADLRADPGDVTARARFSLYVNERNALLQKLFTCHGLMMLGDQLVTP